jgi:hypothetical protein
MYAARPGSSTRNIAEPFVQQLLERFVRHKIILQRPILGAQLHLRWLRLRRIAGQIEFLVVCGILENSRSFIRFTCLYCWCFGG